MNIWRAPALLLLAFALSPVADADDVHLANGGVIRGKARREGDLVIVELEHGTLRLEASKVVEIVSCPSPAELKAEAEARREQALEERLVAARLRGSAGLREVADWAAANGYAPARVAEVRARAAAALEEERRQVFDARLAATDRHDAAALWETALWARRQGHADDVVRGVLELVIGLAPDHAAAREALGQALHRGQWLPAGEVGRILAAEKAEAMRREGFVLFDGEWMKADEARWQDELDRMAGREERAIRDATAAAEESRRLRHDLDEERTASARRAEETERNHREELERERTARRDAETAAARRIAEVEEDCRRRLQAAGAEGAAVAESLRRELQATRACLAESERLRRDAGAEAERAADRARAASCELRRAEPALERLRCLASEVESSLERVLERCRRAVD